MNWVVVGFRNGTGYMPRCRVHKFCLLHQPDALQPSPLVLPHGSPLPRSALFPSESLLAVENAWLDRASSALCPLAAQNSPRKSSPNRAASRLSHHALSHKDCNDTQLVSSQRPHVPPPLRLTPFQA